MPTWDPTQYNIYENERLRPAIDLINRITLQKPKAIYDLGCGTGKITQLLKQRWPSAKIVGIDSSSEMLSQARMVSNDIEWVEGNIETWKPNDKVDLLFSNAVLHWLKNHEELLRRFMKFLKPDGVLAIQVPNNFSANTHVAIKETVLQGRWKNQLIDKIWDKPVGDAEDYYQYLNDYAAYLDIWETKYIHILEGNDPVYNWIQGTALRPFTDVLIEKDKSEFISKLKSRLQTYYPQQTNGKTLMRYRRLFMIARKNKA